jgi:beta-galactosidase
MLEAVPAGVDVAIRTGDRKRVFIFTNYDATPQTITLPATMRNVLDGGTASTITLPRFGVAVFEEPTR